MTNVFGQQYLFEGCIFPNMDHGLLTYSLMANAAIKNGLGATQRAEQPRAIDAYTARSAMLALTNHILAVREDTDDEMAEAELITVECEYSDLEQGEVA